MLVDSARIKHDVVIEGEPIDVDIDPGETISKTFRLPKGSYEFYCAQPEHKRLGMIGE